MKEVKPKALTEEYLREVVDYYRNQPKEEALADVDRLFSKDAILVPARGKSGASTKVGAKDSKGKSEGTAKTTRYPRVTVALSAKSGKVSEKSGEYGKGGSKGGSSNNGPKKK
jgi:hypothetical protein